MNSRWTILLFFILTNYLWGQEKVDTNNVDLELLNAKINEQLNTLRSRKRLDTLGHDNILQDAADDHAQYMSQEKALGHDQKSKAKRTPQDRVLFYNGTHELIGENVQVVNVIYLVDKSKGRLTYDQLAKEIVDNWKGSKPHYANMIREDYALQGLGIKMTSEGDIYLCQVFGSRPFDDRYNYNPGDELHVKNKEECYSCKRLGKQLDKDKAYLGWYTVSNDSIYYWNVKKYEKKNNFRRVFGGNGVIAMDLVHQEQYDCEGKPSYHNSLYHDGYYLGYVSKAKLKNENVSPYTGLYKVFVATKPDFLDTFYQVDFNYIRRYKPCLKNSLIFVNPDFLKPSEYYNLPQLEFDDAKNLVIKDSAEIKIPFERNQTDQDTSIFNPLKLALDSILDNDHTILSIRYTGVASIEGTERENQRLFNKRGEIIAGYLKRYYPQYQFHSEFYENFDDFRSGLGQIGFAQEMSLSDDSLRLFANQHVDDPNIDTLLDNTRYSTVSITYADYIPVEDGTYALSVLRIKDLMAENKPNEAYPVYIYLANKGLESDSTKLIDELLGLSFPLDKSYANLHRAQFILKLKVDETEVTMKDIERLENLGIYMGISPNAEKMEMALLFNVYYGRSMVLPDDFNAAVANARSKRDKAWLNSLYLISQVQNFQISPDVAVASLIDLTVKRKFDANKTYFVCQFLIEWGYTKEPYLLLSKFARRPGQIPKLYKQYIKLAYYLKEFENPKEWKRIKYVVKILAEQYPEEFCSLFRWNEMGVRSLEKPEIAELFCEKCREK